MSRKKVVVDSNQLSFFPETKKPKISASDVLDNLQKFLGPIYPFLSFLGYYPKVRYGKLNLYTLNGNKLNTMSLNPSSVVPVFELLLPCGTEISFGFASEAILKITSYNHMTCDEIMIRYDPEKNKLSVAILRPQKDASKASITVSPTSIELGYTRMIKASEYTINFTRVFSYDSKGTEKIWYAENYRDQVNRIFKTLKLYEKEKDHFDLFGTDYNRVMHCDETVSIHHGKFKEAEATDIANQVLLRGKPREWLVQNLSLIEEMIPGIRQWLLENSPLISLVLFNHLQTPPNSLDLLKETQISPQEIYDYNSLIKRHKL